MSTTFKFYLIALYSAVQDPIVYLRGNPTETHSIDTFTYDDAAFPYDSSGPTWIYSLEADVSPNLIMTISASSEILVGVVDSLDAGYVTGPIDSFDKVGTHTFKLTGALDGSINGITIPLSVETYVTVTIHVVGF